MQHHQALVLHGSKTDTQSVILRNEIFYKILDRAFPGGGGAQTMILQDLY